MLLAGSGAVLLTWRAPGKRSGAYHGHSCGLLGAAALTVVSDNLLTVSAIWVATDILLVARARGSRAQGGATPVWLEVTGSLLMLVAIGITSSSLAAATLTAVALPPETMILLLGVAAVLLAPQSTVVPVFTGVWIGFVLVFLPTVCSSSGVPGARGSRSTCC